MRPWSGDSGPWPSTRPCSPLRKNLLRLRRTHVNQVLRRTKVRTTRAGAEELCCEFGENSRTGLPILRKRR